MSLAEFDHEHGELKQQNLGLTIGNWDWTRPTCEFNMISQSNMAIYPDVRHQRRDLTGNSSDWTIKESAEPSNMVMLQSPNCGFLVPNMGRWTKQNDKLSQKQSTKRDFVAWGTHPIYVSLSGLRSLGSTSTSYGWWFLLIDDFLLERDFGWVMCQHGFEFSLATLVWGMMVIYQTWLGNPWTISWRFSS